MGAHVGVRGVLAAAPDGDGEALARRRLDHHAEVHRVAREDRIAAPGPQFQVREVPPGVQHGHAAHGREEKRQEKSERERVVDRREEQHQQHEAEQVALLRGKDEDAPLDEGDRGRFGVARPEYPVGDRLPQVGEHRPRKPRGWRRR
ncbi:MAG: hypothetical protein IPH30_06655 [Betaproteobacteria bacterium]|nr:hypothetical protein [Betaproteobacteria bacterium]